MNNSDELTDWEQLRKHPSEFVSTILGKDPFDYQQEFLDSKARRKSFVSGRQVGKSLTAAWQALHHAVTNPGSTVLITAPSLRQSAMLFKTLRSEMAESGFDDGLWGVSRDTQTILEFDNNSEIYCLPVGQDGSNIRGYSPNLVVLDEAAFMDDTIFQDVLMPSLFATGGDLVLTSTPWGTSGFFYRNSTRWSSDGDDEHYSTWDAETGGISSSDNPLVEEGDLEEYERGKTSTQIQQEVKGDFVDDGSTFFGVDDIRSAMVDGVKYTGDRVYLGADIAATGSDDTVLTCIDEHGAVFHIERYGEMGVLDAAERIAILDNQYHFDRIVVDRSGLGQGTAEKLRDYGNIGGRVTPIYMAIEKKQTAYQSLKAELERGMLSIPMDDMGVQLREQLSQIGYTKTKTGNLSLHAKQGHDDFVDSLVLAVWALPDTAGGPTRGARGSTVPVSSGDMRNRSRRSDRGSSQGPSEDSQNVRSTTNDYRRSRRGSSRSRRRGSRYR